MVYVQKKNLVFKKTELWRLLFLPWVVFEEVTLNQRPYDVKDGGAC